MSVNLDNMSLADLKKQAKGRGIKQYYIMKKDDLLALLKLPEIPFKYKIEKMTITELRETAKTRGLHGFWGLSKADLTRLFLMSILSIMLPRISMRRMTARQVNMRIQRRRTPRMYG